MTLVAILSWASLTSLYKSFAVTGLLILLWIKIKNIISKINVYFICSSLENGAVAPDNRYFRNNVQTNILKQYKRSSRQKHTLNSKTGFLYIWLVVQVVHTFSFSDNIATVCTVWIIILWFIHFCCKACSEFPVLGRMAPHGSIIWQIDIDNTTR